jgi:hypothetical protein
MAFSKESSVVPPSGNHWIVPEQTGSLCEGPVDPTDLKRRRPWRPRPLIRAVAKKSHSSKEENVVTIGLERQPFRAFPDDLPRDRLRSKG